MHIYNLQKKHLSFLGVSNSAKTFEKHGWFLGISWFTPDDLNSVSENPSLQWDDLSMVGYAWRILDVHGGFISWHHKILRLHAGVPGKAQAKFLLGIPVPSGAIAGLW